ncbi:uncharacterized protein FOMMEDRAFT_109100 [Fomitiporia mediterranea MF3/22]|uniref:uncharacterized protein n=1 Tax=Fomitiporia mediterranea (strain MF3/22) TaxID=694068 RepID=UPI0004409591|nr:uncharacterized protein FOMMEDRAFT_109100 [Fomitiporia mediterranea MF3/22]EJD02008.1 hypothetical protein FOMMEDRAFT_109100 [Fomitiporia mediterranea MF3/22]
MSDVCEPHHDLWGTLLTLSLIVGLFASYVPQHFKIINKGSSEGFSPWFLLLGATSSAAGMLNMWTMQWNVVRCCRYLSTGNCMESFGGIIQVSLQWLLFNVIQILYIIYYPPHLKYKIIDVSGGDILVKTNMKTSHWRTSVVLACSVALHMVVCTFVTFGLLLSTKVDLPASPASDPRIASWAKFLGLTSAALAAIQYVPQLTHTFRLKLVGALSIPMMIIQSPGSALMVISIAMRPGTDWTSWIMFAVSGVMQAILLLMCIAWKIRQHRLNIDDFGHPHPPTPTEIAQAEELHAEEAEEELGGQAQTVPDEEIVRAMLGEDTPLLKNGRRRGKKQRSTSSILKGFLR